MKRIITVLTVICLIAVLVCGCGKKKDNTASGSTNTSPYMLLNFLTISLHCSINGNWSSPTGT